MWLFHTSSFFWWFLFRVGGLRPPAHCDQDKYYTNERTVNFLHLFIEQSIEIERFSIWAKSWPLHWPIIAISAQTTMTSHLAPERRSSMATTAHKVDTEPCDIATTPAAFTGLICTAPYAKAEKKAICKKILACLIFQQQQRRRWICHRE